MADKTVREMSALERKHHSLAARTFRATAMGCVLLGLVALVTGLILYGYILSGQLVRHAFEVAGSAASSATHGADSVTLAEDVMEIYRGLTDEQRQMAGTQEYREFFSSLDLSKGSDHDVLIHMLRSFQEHNDVDYVYLGMYDEATCALVYIADGDPDEPMLPGEWESVTREGLRKFLDWDGTGTLYDIDRTSKYGWMCTAGVPIRNDAGEIVAFLLADVTPSFVWDGLKDYALRISLAILAVTALVAWYLARHMRKTIVEPVNKIAEAARQYAEDRRAGQRDADHFSMLDIRTGDEVENLSLVMADMERDLASYEDDLTKITAEKERISTELSLANRIQAAMLPHIFPPFPGRKEFDIYASMAPAKEVGGDFYDFFLIDRDHLGLVMADVSGKGIPAALFMMASKIILQSCAMLGQTPAEILTKTNEALCSNNQAEMFVTVWAGILEIPTGILTAANAGHEYPILKKPDGSFQVLKDRHGFVIGGTDGVKYTDYEIRLEPGSKLFLYTDGVPEATDAGNRMFGLERLTAALDAAADRSPREILETVAGAVDAFVGDAEQFDDLTMLCFQYNGGSPEGGENVKELTLPAETGNIPEAVAFVDALLEELDCPIKAQTQIDVAMDEILSNIASYAYAPGTGDMAVRFETREEPRTVILTFSDSGMPFDPLTAEEPDVTLPADERKIGGLGIFLVKKTMDHVSYEYRDGRNVLRIEKRI